MKKPIKVIEVNTSEAFLAMQRAALEPRGFGRNNVQIAQFVGDAGRFEDSYRFMLDTAMGEVLVADGDWILRTCLLYTSPSPRD